MSIDKKLAKIKETVTQEGKKQEEELERRIQKYLQQIDQNTKFLKVIESVDSKFKTDNFPDLMKTIIKAGNLVNDYRQLDLSESNKINFEKEFENAKEKFDNLKLEMQQDTKKEIADLLKNIREMSHDKPFELEVENLDQIIEKHK